LNRYWRSIRAFKPPDSDRLNERFWAPLSETD
jgi:hypothetical protein